MLHSQNRKKPNSILRLVECWKSQIFKLFTEENNIVKKPKIIIFDEAETLTEQAQSALRPLLDKPANEILIIFLCNSIF